MTFTQPKFSDHTKLFWTSKLEKLVKNSKKSLNNVNEIFNKIAD